MQGLQIRIKIGKASCINIQTVNWKLCLDFGEMLRFYLTKWLKGNVGDELRAILEAFPFCTNDVLLFYKYILIILINQIVLLRKDVVDRLTDFTQVLSEPYHCSVVSYVYTFDAMASSNSAKCDNIYVVRSYMSLYTFMFLYLDC